MMSDTTQSIESPSRHPGEFFEDWALLTRLTKVTRQRSFGVPFFFVLKRTDIVRPFNHSPSDAEIF